MGIFEEFEKYHKEGEQDPIAFTNYLINFALEGKHLKLDFIRNPNQKKAAKTIKTANYKLSKGFKAAAKMTYNDYLNKLKQGIDDLQLLFSYRTLRQCATFYEEEANIAKDMLEEYKYYLFTGWHFVDNYLLFIDRSDEDMKDHRYY